MLAITSSFRKICVGLTALFAVGVTYAQSSVSLYGVMDGGLLYTSKTLNAITGQNGGKQFSMVDSSLAASEFGLQGQEDFGGGLVAKFKLESGIDVANGGFNDSNGTLFGRQAWIALDSGLGNVKLGLQFSPFLLAVYDSDPRDFSFFGSGGVNYVDNVIATGIFNSNAISYTSPVLAGLQGSVMMALGGEAGNFQAGRQYSASLKYENRGLMINAAIYDGNSGGSLQTPVPTTEAFEGRTLGIAYHFGELTAKASFTNYKVAGSFNNNVYGGGLDYLVSPAIDLNGGVWVTSDRDDTKNHSLLTAISAQYFLSRRTTVYAEFALVNNHGAMDTGLTVNGALYEVAGTSTGVGIGIQHEF